MIKAIGKVQTENREVNQLQSNILSQVNSLSQNAISNGVILPNVSLKSGSNDVNTKLGRKLVGWFIVRQRSSATIYDTQDSNKTPDRTLTLNASADVSVDIYVF
jgi:hypothetical protein